MLTKPILYDLMCYGGIIATFNQEKALVPSRGLPRDYKPSCGPSFEALTLTTNCSQNIVICCHVATTQLLEINLRVTFTDFLTDLMLLLLHNSVVTVVNITLTRNSAPISRHGYSINMLCRFVH